MTLLTKQFRERVATKRRFNNTEIKEIFQNDGFNQPFVDRIEKIYATIPEDRKEEVRGRFQSPDSKQYLSAVWELLIADYLNDAGFGIVWNGEGMPDFTIVDPFQKKYMLEVRGLYESDAQEVRERIKDEIESRLNKVKVDGFLTLSCISVFPLDMDATEFINVVTKWCKNLNPQKTKDEFHYQKEGNHITVTYTRETVSEDQPTIRYFLTSIESNRQKYIKDNVLSEKGKKYGKRFSREGVPIIIALANSSGSSISDISIQSALIGSQTISFFPGTDKTESGLDGKGYITPNRASLVAQNTWLSAVMHFRSNWVEGDQIITPKIIANYWARNQIDFEAFTEAPLFRGREIDDLTIRYEWINVDDERKKNLQDDIQRTSDVGTESHLDAKKVSTKPCRQSKKLKQKLHKEIKPGVHLFTEDWEASVRGAILSLRNKDPEGILSRLVLKFKPIIEHLIEINLNPYLKLEIIVEEIRKLNQQPLRHSKKAADFINEADNTLREYRNKENDVPNSIDSHIENIQMLLGKAFLLFFKAEISYEGVFSQYEDQDSDDTPLSADPELNIFSGIDVHNKKRLLQRIYNTVDPEEELLNELLLTFKHLKVSMKMRPELLALFTNHHIQLNGPTIKKRIQRLTK